MSTLHNSIMRLAAWARTHSLVLVAISATMAVVVTIFATTFRLYDERQARLVAIERLTEQTAANAEGNRQRGIEQCEGINASNETLRLLLDGAIRARTPDSPPITPEARQLTIDTYRRLPRTDCMTGAKTYFDPPFPKE